MGQRTVIIVQRHDKKENKKQTCVFYHQWGVGRILPSQLVSVLNGTLSASEWRPDYVKSLKPQGTIDITDEYDPQELEALDFDKPAAVGEVMRSADNNNGGVFVKITTSGEIGRNYDSIEYAYMLGCEDGGTYKKFCSTVKWLEKNGGPYVDDEFKAYYNQALEYFEAKEMCGK